MRTIGYISTAAFLGALAAGFAVFVKLLPDIRRYARMRNM